jgi:hypothetical protein
MNDSDNKSFRPSQTISHYNHFSDKVFLNPKFKSSAKYFAEKVLTNMEPTAVLDIQEESSLKDMGLFIKVIANKGDESYEPLARVSEKEIENTDEAYQEFTSPLSDPTIKDFKSLKALSVERMAEYLDSLPEDYEGEDAANYITENNKHYFNHPEKAHEETHKSVVRKEPILPLLYNYYDNHIQEIAERLEGSPATRRESIISNEFSSIQEFNAISTELKDASNKVWIMRSLTTVSDFFAQNPDNEVRIFGLLNDLMNAQLFGLRPKNPMYPYLVTEIVSLFGKNVLYDQPDNMYFLNLHFLFGDNFLDKRGNLSKDALFRAGSMIMGQEIKALQEGDGKLKRDNLTIEAAPIIEQKTELLTNELVEALKNVYLWNEFKKQHNDNIPQYLTDNMIKDAFDKKVKILTP